MAGQRPTIFMILKADTRGWWHNHDEWIRTVHSSALRPYISLWWWKQSPTVRHLISYLETFIRSVFNDMTFLCLFGLLCEKHNLMEKSVYSHFLSALLQNSWYFYLFHLVFSSFFLLFFENLTFWARIIAVS